MEDKLPLDILYRPKMGFRVPLADWFRGPLKAQIRELLLGTELNATGLFNQQTIELWLNEHQSGISDHSTALWTLLMFRNFIAQHGNAT